MEEDKRCAIRWKICLPVRYRGLSQYSEGSCYTQDLSTLGAKLSMVERHRAGDRLSIVLSMPGSEPEAMCLDADVVWQKEVFGSIEECNYMTGVVFRKIRDCHKKSILGYISTSIPEQFVQRWWDGVK